MLPLRHNTREIFTFILAQYHSVSLYNQASLGDYEGTILHLLRHIKVDVTLGYHDAPQR